jgi:hypothetical protein
MHFKLLAVGHTENCIQGKKCHKEESQRAEIMYMLSPEKLAGEIARNKKPLECDKKP